ncbi:MAG: CoA-transferase [Deltaproteobacteria bacterium]|jgi:acyl CoA:acetate/3-ketoacid CoA transferase beta subunit|nr:CoA-transferase [Deltaproteobacteria bacterium]MBW2229395.1 CoA-transferase [Deltaproteobacteria bacterium]MBW2382268.1 CoA-transferase [Deltaproteobacteria bacterium]MBW2695565.1 CoA-transferase [Deltaproteobacteria bacterium]
MSEPTRAEVCAVAIAECFRGDGEILMSAFGTTAAVGGRLAKLTFEPDLMMTDGIATAVETVPPVSGKAGEEPVKGAWLPFRTIFDVVWAGTRHVVMMASQIDRFGNQNFACIGPHEKPKAQLLGMRGAPGNTINHKTSYFVPNHSNKVFVEKVDVVSGVGNDRAAALGERSSRFHDLRRVVSNLGVFDFETSDHSMRLVSVHPGVSVDEVVEQTGFELTIPNHVPETRLPTDEELHLIRDVLDPEGWINNEVVA